MFLTQNKPHLLFSLHPRGITSILGQLGKPQCPCTRSPEALVTVMTYLKAFRIKIHLSLNTHSKNNFVLSFRQNDGNSDISNKYG